MTTLARAAGRWMTAGLLAGFMALVLVPGPAEARGDRGHNKKRGKGHYAQSQQRECRDRAPAYSSRRHVRRHAPVYTERRVCRPDYSYRRARPARVYYGGDSFLYRAALGVYVSGVAVNVEVGNVPPRGYIYEDPYCGDHFASVGAYRSHCDHYDHPEYLSVVAQGSWESDR